MPLPPPAPLQPMYRLHVGGRSGVCPSPVTSSQYMEVSRCGDGTIRVSIHTYLDRNGGEIIPARRKILNGVPQTDARGNPSFWPASRLLAETHIADSLLTVPSPQNPSVHLHIGGYARVTLARIRSLEEALDFYRQRDSRIVRDSSNVDPDPSDVLVDRSASDSSPPFIPSLASSSLTPAQTHNLPIPHGDSLP